LLCKQAEAAAKSSGKRTRVGTLTSFIVKREVVCMRLEEHSIKQERILQKQKNMMADLQS
jgi:hypothetical protein